MGVINLLKWLWRNFHVPCENSFYECNVPFLTLMKVIGLFPIKRSSSADFRFEIDKFYLTFALLAYLTMAIISGVMFVHVYYYAYLLTGDLLIRLETYVACTVMLTTVELPFTYLMESPQFGNIFCLWHSFQRNFKLMTKTFIDLRIVKLYAMLHVLFFIFITVQLMVQKPSYIPDLFIYRLAYAYPYVQVMLAYIITHISLKAASIASYEFNLHFEKMADRGRPKELEHYRLLWMELSNLMQETANLYHNTVSLDNYVVIMVGLILHLYRLILVTLSEGMQMGLKRLAIDVFLVLYRHSYFILVLCSHGETITCQCTEQIQRKVNMFRPFPLSEKKKSNFTERVFFHSLIIFKPVLNVHGYYKLKHSTFTSLMAVSFTYLVVLIQFKGKVNTKHMVSDANGNFAIMLQG